MRFSIAASSLSCTGSCTRPIHIYVYRCMLEPLLIAGFALNLSPHMHTAISIYNNFSRTSTRMRLAQIHVCPALRNPDATANAAAFSMAASSNTMYGAFPPSSMLTLFMLSAAFFIKSFPTRVDPVNVILRTSGFVESSAPIDGASPDTTLITPVTKIQSVPVRRGEGGMPEGAYTTELTHGVSVAYSNSCPNFCLVLCILGLSGS